MSTAEHAYDTDYGFFHPDAACRTADTDLFYPPVGAPRTCTAALLICASCPQACRDACLAYAVANNEPGIWGGTTARQRKEIRRTGRRSPRPIGGTRARILAELDSARGEWVRAEVLIDRVGIARATVHKTAQRLYADGLIDVAHGGYYRTVQR